MSSPGSTPKNIAPLFANASVKNQKSAWRWYFKVLSRIKVSEFCNQSRLPHSQGWNPLLKLSQTEQTNQSTSEVERQTPTSGQSNIGKYFFKGARYPRGWQIVGQSEKCLYALACASAILGRELRVWKFETFKCAFCDRCNRRMGHFWQCGTCSLCQQARVSTVHQPCLVYHVVSKRAADLGEAHWCLQFSSRQLATWHLLLEDLWRVHHVLLTTHSPMPPCVKLAAFYQLFRLNSRPIYHFRIR